MHPKAYPRLCESIKCSVRPELSQSLLLFLLTCDLLLLWLNITRRPLEGDTGEILNN